MNRRDVLAGIGAGAAGGAVAVDRLLSSDDADVESTATSTPTATPTPTPTETASPTLAETESPTPTPTETQTPTDSPTPTESPTPTDSPTPSPTDSPTPTATESPTPTETATPTPTATPMPSENVEIEMRSSQRDDTGLEAVINNLNDYDVYLKITAYWEFPDGVESATEEGEVYRYSEETWSFVTNRQDTVVRWWHEVEILRRA